MKQLFTILLITLCFAAKAQTDSVIISDQNATVPNTTFGRFDMRAGGLKGLFYPSGNGYPFGYVVPKNANDSLMSALYFDRSAQLPMYYNPMTKSFRYFGTGSGGGGGSYTNGYGLLLNANNFRVDTASATGIPSKPYVANAVAPKLDKFINGDSIHYIGTDNLGHPLPSYGRANIVKLDTLQSSVVLDSNYNAEVIHVDTDLQLTFSAGTTLGGTDIVEPEIIYPSSTPIPIYRKLPAGTIIYYTYTYSGPAPKVNVWMPQ